MGLLRRIADKFDPAAEQRTVGDNYFSTVTDLNGTRAITPRLAENLSTVLGCVNAISSAIASLPVWVYQRTPGGKKILEDHPLMRMIRNGPNQHQTWPDFLEWYIASTLLRGNGLAEVKRDNAGQVQELLPVPWEYVSVSLLPSGRLAYDIIESSSIYGGTGRIRRIFDADTTHLRDRSDDGLLGRSRLQRAAAVVSVGLSAQEFATSMAENQAVPNGAIKFPQKLTADQRTAVRVDVATNFSGSGNARKLLLLEQGMEFQPLSLSAEDAELLESRRFSTEELCRIFQVPPPLVQDYSHNTFTNSQQASIWFAQHCLGPWIRKLESEFARSLLSEASRQSINIEIDLTGLLRGDPETRWRSHEIAVKNNILDVNEVREMEGFNPKEAGTA